MKKFLDEVAAALWAEYGEGISELQIIFPGKRARLFFNEALLTHTQGRPIWQPNYRSIDELVRSLSSLEPAPHLRLVAELYTVYAVYHPGETFDRFFSWGEMLLADFDTLDKYLVDAEVLYANISDLREIEAHFSNLFADDDQALSLVLDFWRSFNRRAVGSAEEQHFLKIWRSLYAVYTDYKIRLREQGLAYGGMIYREVAEGLREGVPDERLVGRTFCFVGFNALSECEKRLFDHLLECGITQFYWDYDNYYYDSPEQEAGRFIRRNVARFGDADGSAVQPERDNFSQPKRVEVIAAPSDVLQVKLLYAELEKIHARQGFVDKETAIVLTDESLLLPVLHAIPPVVESLNVTMGYPLMATVAYGLLERLLLLQQHRQGDHFAHGDVLSLLAHPYVVERAGGAARTLQKKMTEWQSLWVPPAFFEGGGLLERIFRVAEGVEPLQEYLEELFSEFGAVASDGEEARERKEFIFTMLEHVLRLGNTVRACGIELPTGIYISLLRQTLRGVRIPYEGEPLSGLQIMGILETRNLDFDNVILLSLTDDTFPGSREGNSYVPFNLRQAFGLPTAQDHEAMYAYYFYRLIARCEYLTLMYSSSAEENRTGEQSRYIYQLEYESPHTVERTQVNLRVDYRPVEPIVLQKTPEVLERLAGMRFSPSRVNRYVDCPLKFYLTDVEQLVPQEELTGEITALDVGNTLHHAMEILYKPFVGGPLGAISTQQVREAVEQAMEEVMGLRGVALAVSGRMQLHRDVVVRYARQIIEYDAERYGLGFSVQGLELRVSLSFSVGDGKVELAGVADRVDLRADGVRQVVDYKSGGDDTKFSSVEALFTNEGVTRDGEVKYQRHNGALLQTMLYALMLAGLEEELGGGGEPVENLAASRALFEGEERRRITSGEKDFTRNTASLVSGAGTVGSTGGGMTDWATASGGVAAALYVARRMGAADYSPYPVTASTGGGELSVLSTELLAELGERLEGLFAELLNPMVPIAQTPHRETCAYCDFRAVCRR